MKPNKTEIFIEKSKLIHGEIYDYSKVNYINNKTPIIIICKKHGEFIQQPYNHLAKCGCKLCCKNNYTIDNFIEKAKQIHGNKYDYSLVDYKKSTIPVKIICPEHGVFEQTPATHIKTKGNKRGGNCPKCSKTYKLTTEEFIKRTNKVHGDKYDYSKTIYVSNILPLIITCKKHGDFLQTPNSHLSSKDGSKGNCPMCAKNILTKDEFIEKAKNIHKDKYLYDKVIYTLDSEKIIITCPTHGEFLQTPKSHLKGNGCNSCSGLKPLTIEEFIKKAKEVHGNKYNYSESVYINSNTKIKIICPKHGPFYQTHTIHLSNFGCSKCSGMHNKTTEEFINELKVLYIDKYDYKDVVYINNRTKVLLHCTTHGEFLKTPKELLKNTGCPTCKSSVGENNTEKLLKECGFEYIKQYKFPDCKHIKPLSFDFYLPIENLCIEYDGEQHYKPVKFFGGEKGFIETQIRDNIKTNYCKENNIHLIRIRYDENIIEKIEEFFTPNNTIY